MDQTRDYIYRRIRNRIIEYLELASSFERQLDYEIRAPVSIPNEMFNQWDDWVSIEKLANYRDPIFNAEERNAMLRYNAALEVAFEELSYEPDLRITDLVGTNSWSRLREEAQIALAVFHETGTAVRGQGR